MSTALFHLQRQLFSSAISGGLNTAARLIPGRPGQQNASVATPPLNPCHPEDFRPLENSCFQNPYRFYQMLRDQFPVYKLANGVVCVSRYQDIVDLSRNVETFSSEHQGVVANLRPGQNLLKQVRQFETLARLGIIPADVLATSDPPLHTSERKVGHSCLNNHFVKQLEPEVEALCREMMAPFLARGEMEFMQAFGWRLPMILIIRLLGLPEQDFEKIKAWCVQTLDSQNGIQTGPELARSYGAVLTFIRYCWHHFRTAKRAPKDNLMGVFVRAQSAPDSNFTEAKAVSAIFQLLVAGSDSSATTMGNALKMLIEHPELHEQLRDEPEMLPAFIEEVFRLESAFQGHFRWTKQDTELQGVTLPKGSRIFLMWASGNRDERFWEEPDQIRLNRKNGKKHLTFGHGIHACLGRELARMEIRVVLRHFLEHTRNLRIVGETPYIASMFARTLVQLPIRFDAR